MISAALIAPFAGAYARHAGLPIAEGALRGELERRLGLAPRWARAHMALGALLARWVFPLLLLGAPRRFERLSEGQREALLRGLQRESRLPLRAAFLGVKSIVLGLCYGRPEFLETIGYGSAEAPRG